MNRTVTLLGSSHFLKYAPSSNGLVEKLIDMSDQVFFENAGYTERGSFLSQFSTSKRTEPTGELDSFVNANDIDEISQAFGVPMSGDTQTIYFNHTRHDRDNLRQKFS